MYYYNEIQFDTAKYLNYSKNYYKVPAWDWPEYYTDVNPVPSSQWITGQLIYGFLSASNVVNKDLYWYMI